MNKIFLPKKGPNAVRQSILKPVEGSGLSSEKRYDYFLFAIVLILSVFGLIMVFDASQFEAFQQFGDKYYFIKQQAIWMILGLIALGFFSRVNYHYLEKIALPAFLLSIFLLFLVFIPKLGVSAGGAHRWLKISFLTIQPAEIIKLSACIFFAYLLRKQSKVLAKKRDLLFICSVGFVALVVGIFQKDLGTSIVFSLVSFSIYFASGAPLSYFAGFFILGLLGSIGFIFSSSYRRERILAFMDPFRDPQGFSYHISQVLIALGSGGLFGLGIGQSRQKFAYIPEVTTDSIFSVIGEELGFLGSLILVILIGALIIKCFQVAEKAPDDFGRLLAIGLTAWIGSQAIVNLMAMVSLIPLTGVPLPFISYGGSALLANLVAVGILLNISKQSL